jgi:hypothetical protein
MDYEYDARARLTGEWLHVDIDVKLLGAGSLSFEPLGFAACEAGGDRGVKCVIANDFEQGPAFDLCRSKIILSPCGRVREYDPLARVDGNHAFDHSAEHGRLARRRLAELRHPQTERVAHLIKRTREYAELVSIRNINAMLIVARRDCFSSPIKRLDRPRDYPHEPVRETEHDQRLAGHEAPDPAPCDRCAGLLVWQQARNDKPENDGRDQVQPGTTKHQFPEESRRSHGLPADEKCGQTDGDWPKDSSSL